MRRMLLVFTAAMVVALMMLAMALPAFAGGGGDDEDNDNESANGGATRNGQIVFRRWFDPDHTKGALFAMNPDGSHIRQITHPPKGWNDDNPAWSPDGQRVAFHRQRTNGYMSRITVHNLQTGDTREVTHCGPDQGWTKEHPPPSSGRYCASDFEAAFSPDGHSIAFHRILGLGPSLPGKRCCEFSGIFIVGLDGSDPHQVTNVDPKLPAEFEDESAAFSPDGETLVIDRERRGQKAPKLVKLGEEEPYYHAAFVQSLDSSGEPEDAHQITPWKLNCQDHPEFSPDGELVLFRCLPKGGEGPSNLYWVHPDGTGLHALTHEDADKQYGGSSFSPSFSDGEGWITAGRTAGYGKEGNADVFRLLIKDGEVVRSVNLTKSAIWDSAPGWGTHPPVH
jgi:dipeptidyl aminopeptidase/acylaminoacyl peptidase